MSIEEVKSLMDVYFDFDLGIACIVFLVVYSVYAHLVQKENMKKRRRMSRRQIVYGILLSLYLMLLLVTTVFNRSAGSGAIVELELFWSYREVMETGNRTLLFQMLYNVVVFIPWGWLFARVSKVMRKVYWNVGSALAFSLAIEVVQLVFACGTFEFDDMFHNTLGATIGYVLWLVYRLFQKKRKR